MNEKLPNEAKELFEKFEQIFNKDNRHFNDRTKNQLKSLGFEVYGDSHPKIKIGNTIITMQSTSSDRNTNRVILRRIRKVLIKEFGKGE